MSELKSRREQLGLTLRDVEKITDGAISNAYLSQLENGKIRNPSVSAARALAAAYMVPIAKIIDFLNLSDAPLPPSRCPTCGHILVCTITEDEPQ